MSNIVHMATVVRLVRQHSLWQVKEKHCVLIKNPSTVATIWKNKDKILHAETEGSSCKKIRKPKFEDLDQAMLTWFHKQRCNNVLISGPVLKTKAEHFALQLGIIDFKASEGWLGKFKQRHNITYGKISGEALNVDLNVTNSWLINVWPKLNEKYTPDNIFNADETGIFYKMTPDKALNFKGEKSVGGKLSKERITAFVAANMSGTEKRKITVIGKSKNPRCFKNIKRLPVTVANKSAWMTSILFEEEIRKWDAELKGRKVLLLVNIQNYVEMDENLVTTISLTDEEILNAVTKGEEEQKEDEDEEAQPDEVVIPSIQQALDAAKLLEKYLFHEDDPNEQVMEATVCLYVMSKVFAQDKMQ
ncbi:PREDICTED: tigger transposable element-derived protein 4-like [Diuraphis noxia]|uniref:tigger transposable element-derived protein 4-like n=1 Tax=Diuraphis noxia TaxID=143948 RepID=UPI00076376D5|nr:PREDICTED: tigger transposable element-derived protein 4-like [Diuraphis noxia]